MESTYRFFKLIQTTRAMPQTGYVISGIKKSDLSDLAQHHYLVTIIAWQLISLIKKNKGKIDAERVLEICLIHDLGELLGGDIAMPYGKANTKADQLAKRFEQENQSYLSSLMPNSAQVKNLFKESVDLVTDASLVTKIADYVEVTHYKHYLGRLTEGDLDMVKKRMSQFAENIKNRQTRQAMTIFIENWSEMLRSDDNKELFEAAKSGKN